MTLPLAGVRILDLSNVQTGPFCSYNLARLGAEVIKTENPDGGISRAGSGPIRRWRSGGWAPPSSR